jgi:hypothetical protein
MMHGLNRGRNKKQGARGGPADALTHFLFALRMKPRDGAERLQFHHHCNDIE